MAHVSDAEPTKRLADARVARIAAGQYGVFTRAQAAGLGVTRGMVQRRLAAGKWEQPARGVFRMAGVPVAWRQSLMVACLAWGVGAVVSHRAAAALWRLAGFEPGPIEVTVPCDRRRIGAGTVRRNTLSPGEVTRIDAIPVTSPARTLLDVAAVAPRDVVEEALDDALRRGLVSMPRMRWCLNEWERSRRKGVAVMRALIDARDLATSVPRSVFETRLLRVMSRAALPEFVRQYPVRNGTQLVAVLDFAFPDARLGIEADGYRWHSGRTRWEHDRARRNRLTLLGWRIINVTWSDLTGRPDVVVDSITSALRETTF